MNGFFGKLLPVILMAILTLLWTALCVFLVITEAPASFIAPNVICAVIWFVYLIVNVRRAFTDDDDE